jgi:L-iditol 2-dehydrogenase
MKAAIVSGLKSMQVTDVPDPVIDEYAALVRVHACGICGSDIRILENGNSRVSYPAIIGHEIVGEVIQIGKSVRNVRQGDMLAIGADLPCGECDWCNNGMGNCCDKNYAMGYQLPGGFAQYCVLSGNFLQYGPYARIPIGITEEEAALTEPLACCINGMERTFFSPGKSTLVIGAGPIGVLLTLLARAFGSPTTMLADINADRLQMARVAYADHLINSDQSDLKDVVMDITRGRGADRVFTACASPDAQEDAIKVVAKRGVVNFFGGLPDSSRSLQLSSNLLHYKEVYVTGSHGSTPRQFQIAMDLISAKRINVSPLVTHRFPLNKIEEAFETTRDMAGLKVLVNPN